MRTGILHLLRALCLATLLSGLTGCVTLRFGRAPGPIELEARDAAFAEALAHFAQGLIYQSSLGASSPLALEELVSATELDPSSLYLQTRLAQSHLRQGQTADAIAVLERARAMHPDSLEIRIELAANYQLAGQLDQAIKHYQKAVDLAPDSTFLCLAVARLRFATAKDRAALDGLRAGLTAVKQPATLLAYCQAQGATFIRAKEWDRAIRCFELLAANAPDHSHRYHQEIGELQQAAGHLRAAEKSFRRALEGEPPLPSSFISLSLLRLRAGSDAAVDVLKDGLTQLPDDPLILFSLAYLYARETRFDESIATFAHLYDIVKATDETKLSPAFYLHYGATCETAGQYAKAVEVFSECIEVYPECDEVLNYLAYMWAERGEELDAAHGYAVRALAIEPDNGAYVDTLGWVYYRQRKYEEAATAIQRANELLVDDPTVVEHLGDVHRAMDDVETAVSFWKKSLRLDPDNEGVAAKLAAQGLDLRKLRREARKLKRTEKRTTQSVE